VLVGWAAVRNDVAWAPVVLFIVMFLWTPPHFWALAIRYADDYRAASVPMLPAVETARSPARKMVAYTVVMVAFTLVLIPVAGLGLIYGATAVVAGGLFLWSTVRPSAKTPHRRGRCECSDSASRTSRCCSPR
jgi:protoheme IX farnesyltransferase